MKKTGKINLIEVENIATWHDKNFLTIDIDWAHDEIIYDTICLVEKTGVRATWFVTHETCCLKLAERKGSFFIGSHRNFVSQLMTRCGSDANDREKIEKLNPAGSGKWGRSQQRKCGTGSGAIFQRIPRPMIDA